MKTVFFLCLALSILAACGNAATTHTDLAMTETAVDMSSGGTKLAGNVVCGKTICSISGGERCCATSTDGVTSTGTCGATCGANTIAYSCDGPEDCSGKACCYEETSGNVTQGCDATKSSTQP